jgi:hypothetical protein
MFVYMDATSKMYAMLVSQNNMNTTSQILGK